MANKARYKDPVEVQTLWEGALIRAIDSSLLGGETFISWIQEAARRYFAARLGAPNLIQLRHKAPYKEEVRREIRLERTFHEAIKSALAEGENFADWIQEAAVRYLEHRKRRAE